MTRNISRSTGYSPGVPWAGPLPGGGYSGETPELDAAVVALSEWLADTFGVPVVVRFNADRRSGGAFLASGSFLNDAGVTAELRNDGSICYAALASGKYARKWNEEKGRFYLRTHTADAAKQTLVSVVNLQPRGGRP